MAYDGGYGGQPYGGPMPQQRPAPRQYGAPPPQQYGEPQHYDAYDDGYGYDGYNGGGGYGQQEYGGQYQDANYARGPPPPPQDPYGPGPARGGPIARPPTADGHHAGGPYPPRGGMAPAPGRGMPPGPGGRGGMRPGPYSSNSDPSARRPVGSGPTSPRDAGFGHKPFPEQQMVDQMAGMDINGQRSRVPPGARMSSESQRSQGSYGQPPMNGGRGPPPRGYPPQGHPDARRGPPPGQEPVYASPGGYSEYDDGHGPNGQGLPRGDFSPPGRSMTMPATETSPRQMPPPQRMGSMPYNGPAGQAVPQRPSTAAGHHPPPQRAYPSDPRGPPPAQYGGDFNEGPNYGQQPRASLEGGYDQYYDNTRYSNHEYDMHQRQSQASLPDFDAMPPPGHRGSFEATMRPGLEQPQRGAAQMAKLGHAKSQPDLRQPQTAIFEMAGDIPEVPPLPAILPYQPGAEQGFGGPGGYDAMPPRGPSAPPGPGAGPGPGPGLPSHPAMMRLGATPQSRSSDGISSHPAPVRPGLMANSMVNMNDKPPPVRNYGGIPQSVSAPPQQMQMQQQPKPQQAPVAPKRRSAPQTESPVTSQELEQLRQAVKHNHHDQTSALRLAKKLIEAADVLIPRLPDPKSRARARERYLTDAHKILKKLASGQNMEAMFFLADSVGRGLFSHEPDSKEAFTLYQSAAKLGHPAAAYRTAVCCEIGHEEGGGTRKDPMKAIQWYKRAATLGDPPAMYKVGMILLKGLLGQPKNHREAVGWLKRAAERADAENPHALHELGLLYETAQPNDVIIRDEGYALSLFIEAAELGYKFSQHRLGCVYEYGLLGCPIDPRLSIMWYSRAATQEEHQAELALSGWYLTGSEGVLGQSDTEAYLWARKAALAGLAKAEYAMGYFTEVGIGVPANLEDAKRWYWRAAAQDYPKARERLEDLKRVAKHGGSATRQRERISRTGIEKQHQQQDGDCVVM